MTLEELKTRYGLDVKFSNRGFAYIELKDKYEDEFILIQSSAKMTDFWISKKNNKADSDLLLDYELIVKVNAFALWLKEEFE